MFYKNSTHRYSVTLPDGAAHAFPALAMVNAFLCQLCRENPAFIGGQANLIKVETDGHSVPVIQRYSEFGVSLEHDTRKFSDILTMMFEEMKPFTFAEDGSPLKPFQMTKHVWDSLKGIGSLAYGVIPGPTSTHRSQDCELPDGTFTDCEGFVSGYFYKNYGYGHNGPAYNELSRDTNCRHELHVAYALARGANVPQAVIDEYLANPAWYPSKPFQLLLQEDWARGRMNFSHMETLFNRLREPEVDPTYQVTRENIGRYSEIVSGIAKGERFWNELDNTLYEAGILKMRALYPMPAPQPLAVNAFAQVYFDLLKADTVQEAMKGVEDGMSRHNWTNRERDYQLAIIRERIPFEVSMARCNGLAELIESKDIVRLLGMLDGPNAPVAHKAIKQHFGIKLGGVKASERRRKVFELAGYVTAEQVAEAEAMLQGKKIVKVIA